MNVTASNPWIKLPILITKTPQRHGNLNNVQMFMVTCTVINGNFKLVNSWQISSKPNWARALFVPFGYFPSHTLKPNWAGLKG